MIETRKPTYWKCRECSKEVSSEMMQCPSCRAIDSFEPVFTEGSKKQKPKSAMHVKPLGVKKSKVMPIYDVVGDDTPHIDTGSSELNRMFGGGIKAGKIVSLAGDPGAGKSTLMAQVAGHLSKTLKVLYNSGEENPTDLRDRAQRLGLVSNDRQLFVVQETDVEVLLEDHLPNTSPDVIIIDSIQMMYSSKVDGAPGYEKQLMYVSTKLQEYAKSRGVILFIVSQATKGGDMAGSNKLLHLVDAGLHLMGEDYQAFRILRSLKNRMFNAQEVGVFRMSGRGLIDVTNPSEEFLAERMIANPGSAVAVVMEGERPLLVEVQALTNDSGGGNPARHLYGFPRDRAFIPVVIDKFLPYVDLIDQNLTTNVVGGISIRENAADLPMAMAVVSSFHGVPTPPEWIGIGEVGLTGEVRTVPRIETRLKEAFKIGFTNAIVPKLRESIQKPKGMAIHEVRTVDEAVQLMFQHKIDFQDWS